MFSFISWVALVFVILLHKFLDSVLEAIVKWLTDCTVDVGYV